jgi:probable addiction module antidote protein
LWTLAWLTTFKSRLICVIDQLHLFVFSTKPLTGQTNMSKRINVADLPEFDAAQYLDSDEIIAAYLTDILEANDAALLASALGTIARARGMTEIAKAAGITREALYKALRPNSAPRFDTISRVCAALGVRLVAKAVGQ